MRRTRRENSPRWGSRLLRKGGRLPRASLRVDGWLRRASLREGCQLRRPSPRDPPSMCRPRAHPTRAATGPGQTAVVLDARSTVGGTRPAGMDAKPTILGRPATGAPGRTSPGVRPVRSARCGSAPRGRRVSGPSPKEVSARVTMAVGHTAGWTPVTTVAGRTRGWLPAMTATARSGAWPPVTTGRPPAVARAEPLAAPTPPLETSATPSTRLESPPNGHGITLLRPAGQPITVGALRLLRTVRRMTPSRAMRPTRTVSPRATPGATRTPLPRWGCSATVREATGVVRAVRVRRARGLVNGGARVGGAVAVAGAGARRGSVPAGRMGPTRVQGLPRVLRRIPNRSRGQSV